AAHLGASRSGLSYRLSPSTVLKSPTSQGAPMHRRQFHLATVGALIVAAHRQAWALSLADLSDREATSGIRTALEKGALAAVALLGKTDGFLGNPKVRIPLPGYLEDAAKFLRFAGQGRR